MVDQKVFAETLQAVKEIARATEGPLSKEEVTSYFKGMELSKEQEELVYQFFLKMPEEEQQEKETSSELLEASKEQKEAERIFLQSPFVKMYLDDIKNITILPKQQMQECFAKLVAGEEQMVTEVVNQYLHEVVEMAKNYVLLGVPMQDVVQEGNMGLLLAVSSLQKQTETDPDSYIRKAIQNAMETYIDEMVSDDDWEQVVLQRATLLHEAEEALAKELLRVPTVEELSEYTKLPEQEIADIRALIVEKEQN